MRSQQTSATNAPLQGSAQKAALPGSSQASGLPQATSTGQTLAVAQAASGSAGQSLNLSQGAAGSNGVSGGVVASGGSQTSTGLSQTSSAGTTSSCQRKGTGVVQPLPVAAAQAVTVSQGSQTETDNAATKKGETESGGQQTVGMNLTRTATPAPSQTLISSGKCRPVPSLRARWAFARVPFESPVVRGFPTRLPASVLMGTGLSRGYSSLLAGEVDIVPHVLC